MELSIVIVNYNSKHRLKCCIDAIYTNKPLIDFEVLIIDNRSTDGSCTFLHESAYSSCRLVVNPKAMGYTSAANQGFILAKGDIILFLNPDIRIVEHSIDNMMKHLEEDRNVGAVAGYYLLPDGTFHKYYNRFPTIWPYYLTVFFGRKLVSNLKSYSQYHMLDTDFSKPVEVPQPAGGCLLLRKGLFREDFMNPIFCIFFSDVDVCRKIYAAGKRIMTYPDCIVIHDHDRHSRSDGGLSDLYALDLYIGCANYFRIYSGFKAFLTVKLLFGITLLASTLLSLGKSVLGTKPWKEPKGRMRTLYYFVLHRNVLLEHL